MDATRDDESARAELADLLDEAMASRAAMHAGRRSTTPSPADDDLGTADAAIRPAVVRLYSLVDLWSLITTDHVHGLAILIRDGTTVYAFFPVVRSIVEHCSAIVWLLEGVDTRERAARGAVLQLRAQEESAKAASHLAGKGSPTHNEAKGGLTSLRKLVADEFGTLELEPLSVDGITHPKPTEFVAHFGRRWGDETKWTGAYDYLCSTANHPNLLAAEFLDAEDLSTPPHMSLEFLMRILGVVMVPYLKTLEYFVAYHGYESEPIDLYIDRVNDLLGGVLIDSIPTDGDS